MLESAIERAVVNYAKSKGIEAIKLSTAGAHGTSGWPDRLFLAPGRKALWVEFKQPGKKPTPRQMAKLDRLEDLGWKPWVVTDVQQGKELIDVMLGAA